VSVIHWPFCPAFLSCLRYDLFLGANKHGWMDELLHSGCTARSSFFAERIVNIWNSLLADTSVRENVCNNSKNVKSRVFWLLKKNIEKRTYSFTGHLITQPLITQLPEVSTGKSLTQGHQHLTSCSEVRTQETMQTRTVCEKTPISTHNIREFWRQNFCRHSANLTLFVTFYDFLIRHFKKGKSYVFWKSEKNVKYVFSNTGWHRFFSILRFY